jgi:tRNA(fMet)-specific endonuclease VapC
MNDCVVDTNVVSYLLKGDSRAALYAKHVTGRRLCISFMTVAELYAWAILKKWGAKRIADLRSNLVQYVVLPYDDAMAWQWATVTALPGHPIAAGDAWIAAAALRFAVPLITHNRKHFEHIPGLAVMSEA